MKRAIIFIINAYQKVFSPETGVLTTSVIGEQKICLFYPSCSEYTKQAVSSYGAVKGIFLGVKRVARCHPFQVPRVDPVE